jgi:hypothetical protein
VVGGIPQADHSTNQPLATDHPTWTVNARKDKQ